MIGFQRSGGILLAALMLLALPFTGVAQVPDPTEPSWLLLARGDALLDAREPSAALRFYRAALATAPNLPEADLGIARVYRADGNFRLALDHYQRATDQARNLLVAQDEFALIYEYADLLQDLGETARARDLLQDVVDESEEWSGPESLVRQGLPVTATLRGPERALELFRLSEDGPIEAHARLSSLLADELAGDGAPDEQALRRSFDHAVFALYRPLSVLVEAVIAGNPPFEFRTFPGLFAELGRLRLDSVPQELSVFIRATELAQRAQDLRQNTSDPFGAAVPADPQFGPGVTERLQALEVSLLSFVITYSTSPVERRRAQALLGDR